MKKIKPLSQFIGGRWSGDDNKSSQFDVTSPRTGEVIAKVSSATDQEIEKALNVAQQSQQGWAETPIKERSQVLQRFRSLLERDFEKISETIVLENGKTSKEADAEIHKGIEVLDYALSLQNLDHGGRLSVSRGVSCEYRRKPVGVIASITPFNFPAMVPMWTIPNALALGNSYVWKPSEKTPLTSRWIANLLSEAGLPDGVFTVLNGGPNVVERLLESPQVQALAFVGSSPVAQLVYEKGSANGKRVLALGGAKNHIVLLPDADTEISGRGISDSFTGCAGQRCMAASVLLAVGNVDEYIGKIVERASSLKLGVDMGSIISESQRDFLFAAIDRAEKEGAKILVDGRKAMPDKKMQGGFWLGPTVLDHVKPGSEAAERELFGPILSVIRCESLSEAIAIENSSAYGNACSVFTRSGALAEQVLGRARAAMLGVNIGVPVPREPFSFAGIGISKYGHGEITGEGSLGLMSDLQKVTTKWEAQSDQNWMS